MLINPKIPLIPNNNAFLASLTGYHKGLAVPPYLGFETRGFPSHPLGWFGFADT